MLLQLIITKYIDHSCLTILLKMNQLGEKWRHREYILYHVFRTFLKAYDIKNLTNVERKGTENYFTDYFQINDNQLHIKADLKESDIAYLKRKDGKKDLTGYVTYTAYHGNNGYGKPYVTVKTVKITVKL